MLEHAVNRTAKPIRQFTTVGLVACIISLFLYWNPSVNALFSPLQYALIALIAPITFWTLGTTLVQVVVTSRALVALKRNNATVSMASSAQAQTFDIDDDDIDLDYGTSPIKQNDACGQAIGKLFSQNATLDDSVSGLMTLFGASLEDENPAEMLPALLAQWVVSALILIPPLWMSLHLIAW